MKNKAIFLDRDGTINENKSGYTQKLEDLEIIPGVIEGLRELREAGYKLIILTNQSGIARGYYTEEDYFKFRNAVLKRLNKGGVIISGEYFCPHHPEKGIGNYKIDCDCRKPKTGMLEEATRDLNLDLRECWVIGDSSKDIEMGKSAGCRTIHVLTGEEKNPIRQADFAAKNMIEAAEYILKSCSD